MSDIKDGNILNIVPVAAIMLITEMALELQKSDPALGARLAARFRALGDSPLGQSNPDSMELVNLLANELEQQSGHK